MTKPDGSQLDTQVQNASNGNFSITPDVVGTFVVEVRAKDSDGESDPVRVTIKATP